MSEPALKIVETTGLGHDYGTRVALADVDLALERGEIFALLGPNGGGKSTLFRILSTSMRPTRGHARVLGFDVVDAPSEVRRRVGVAFQSPSLDPKLTVRENLMHQGHLYGIRGRELSLRIEDVLGRLGLAERRRDRAETLSGGLARRVDLAKALLHEPPLLLLDEPSTGLDPSARAELLTALIERRDGDGTTSLITTHLMDEAEECDRVGILDRGRLVACGTPRELVRRVGRDVITLVADDADGLARALNERHPSLGALASGDQIRCEREDGASLLPELLSGFGSRVRAATVARPTLADVFFHETGRRFETAEAT